MPNLVWKIDMKVNEITLSEAEITIKPLPGAQQLSVDGKPIGQANDPAVAQQISQAAKDGKLTLNDPTKPQMGSQGAGIQEQPGSSVPYYVDMSSGKPMAKTGGRGTTAIVPSKLWTAITPEIELKACGDGRGNAGQGFRKVMLQHNGKQIPGLEGGDQAMGSKIIVAPADYQSMSTPMRESDDELARWKSIAGL
jgi:hypothetical protein